MRVYGTGPPFLLFLGGVALVGVYLAVVYMYTPLPTSALKSFLALVDGAAFAMVSTIRHGSTPPAFIINDFLVEGTTIWIAILVLAWVSWKPTPAQRVASIGIMLVALGTTAILFWPYLRAHLWGQWTQIAWLVGGIIEGTWVRFRLLESEAIVRSEDDASIRYIALLILLWVAALIAGNVLHEING